MEGWTALLCRSVVTRMVMVFVDHSREKARLHGGRYPIEIEFQPDVGFRRQSHLQLGSIRLEVARVRQSQPPDNDLAAIRMHRDRPLKVGNAHHTTIRLERQMAPKIADMDFGTVVADLEIHPARDANFIGDVRERISIVAEPGADPLAKIGRNLHIIGYG